MDSAIVLFGGASFEEVEREASIHGFVNGTVSHGSEHFYLWRYSEEEMKAEHEANELEAIRKTLGTEVKSAFQVACRHGEDARFAIQVVSSLMSKFKPSVLDDDFGSLWLPDQVATRVEANPKEGLYALRSDA